MIQEAQSHVGNLLRVSCCVREPQELRVQAVLHTTENRMPHAYVVSGSVFWLTPLKRTHLSLAGNPYSHLTKLCAQRCNKLPLRWTPSSLHDTYRL